MLGRLRIIAGHLPAAFQELSPPPWRAVARCSPPPEPTRSRTCSAQCRCLGKQPKLGKRSTHSGPHPVLVTSSHKPQRVRCGSGQTQPYGQAFGAARPVCAGRRCASTFSAWRMVTSVRCLKLAGNGDRSAARQAMFTFVGEQRGLPPKVPHSIGQTEIAPPSVGAFGTRGLGLWPGL